MSRLCTKYGMTILLKRTDARARTHTYAMKKWNCNHFQIILFGAKISIEAFEDVEITWVDDLTVTSVSYKINISANDALWHFNS
jgi:hypothetical protein